MKRLATTILLCCVVLICGCGKDQSPPSNVKSTGTTQAPSAIPPNVKDKIEGSLKSDLEKLEPTLIVDLVDYKVAQDDVGIVVEALWDYRIKPQGDQIETGGKSIFGRSGRKSRLRYDANGVFVRRIVDDQSVKLP